MKNPEHADLVDNEDFSAFLKSVKCEPPEETGLIDSVTGSVEAAIEDANGVIQIYRRAFDQNHYIEVNFVVIKKNYEQLKVTLAFEQTDWAVDGQLAEIVADVIDRFQLEGKIFALETLAPVDKEIESLATDRELKLSVPVPNAIIGLFDKSVQSLNHIRRNFNFLAANSKPTFF